VLGVLLEVVRVTFEEVWQELKANAAIKQQKSCAALVIVRIL
jgi:hypothetical protein